MAYGVIKQGEAKSAPWFKNDDRIELNSKVGKKASEKWYYSGLVNFRTQFNYGYNNPIYYRDFDGRAPKGMLDPYLVFDGQKNKLYIYDDNDTPDDPSDDVLIGTFDAHNLTVRRSQGKWEDGTYSMFDKKTRHTHTTLETKGKWAFERLLDSPNSSYGKGGIYRANSFTQTNGKYRSGMAIHAGREDRSFLTRRTKGCC